MEQKSNSSVPKKPIIVIGIGGPSGSGKSTLASYLHFILKSPFPLFKLDDFFYFNGTGNYFVTNSGRKLQDWEQPSAIDWNSAIERINSILSKNAKSSLSISSQVLIIEGFLIFAHEYFQKICDVKFFLTGNREVFSERRRLRHKKEKGPYWDEFYDELVWPSYLKNNHHILSQLENGNSSSKDYIFLDANQDLLLVLHCLSLHLLFLQEPCFEESLRYWKTYYLPPSILTNQEKNYLIQKLNISSKIDSQVLTDVQILSIYARSFSSTF